MDKNNLINLLNQYKANQPTKEENAIEFALKQRMEQAPVVDQLGVGQPVDLGVDDLKQGVQKYIEQQPKNIATSTMGGFSYENKSPGIDKAFQFNFPEQTKFVPQGIDIVEPEKLQQKEKATQEQVVPEVVNGQEVSVGKEINKEVQKAVKDNPAAAVAAQGASQKEIVNKVIEKQKPKSLDEFMAAFKKAQDAQALGVLLNSFNQIGASIAGMGGTTKVQTGDSAKAIAALGKQDLDKLQAERAFSEQMSDDEIKEINRNLARDMNDAGSGLSVMARQMARKALGREVPENISAAQLKAMGVDITKSPQAMTAYQQAMLALQTRRAIRDEQREDRLSAKDARIQKQQVLNFAQKLKKEDPRFKKTVEQFQAFQDVDNLIENVEKGNELAMASLGTKLARAMGEVGVLTDTDVVRYVRGQSWGRSLLDWFKKGAVGRPSDATLKEMQKNVKTIKSRMVDDVNNIYSTVASQMKRVFPEVDDEQIKGVLGSPVIQKSEPRVAFTLDGKRNVSIPAYQVDAFMKKFGDRAVFKGEL